MGSLRRSIELSADSGDVWEAVRDFKRPGERLVPGFVVTLAATETQRVVQFSDGNIALERLVAIDDVERRLVYSAIDGRSMHHNAAIEVHDAGQGRAIFEWTVDVLPDEIQPYIEANMDGAIPVLKALLEGRQKATP